MLTNADITIYNYHMDKSTGAETWLPTSIKGVWMHSAQETVLSEKGLSGASKHNIRVPVNADFSSKQYIPWDQYRFIDNPGDHWTIADGDFICKGVTNVAFEDVREGPYMTVMSFSENLFGLNQHYRISSKSVGGGT